MNMKFYHATAGDSLCEMLSKRRKVLEDMQREAQARNRTLDELEDSLDEAQDTLNFFK